MRPLNVLTVGLVLLLIGCNSTTKKELNVRQALVIGNSNYQIAPLTNPKNDVEDMSFTLTKLGFDVTRLEDLKLSELKNEIDTFFRTRTNQNTQLFFYYAGHAIQQNDKNYLITVNNDIEQSTSLDNISISFDYVIDKVKMNNVDLSIMVLDACRNNPYSSAEFSSNGRALPESFRGLKRSQGLAQVFAPANTLIAFSTSPGNVAYDGSGRNGTYTKYLLEAMETPRVSIDRIFSQVRTYVINETQGKQIPWEHSSLYKYDFYLVQPDKKPKIKASW